MELNTICCFMHLRNGSTDYRILYVSEQYSVLLNMNKPNRLDILLQSNTLLRQKIHTGEFTVIEDPLGTVVDIENLPEPIKAKYLRNKSIVDSISKLYAPEYTGLTAKQKLPIINDLMEQTGLTRKSVWAIIIKYLQSGCKESSLLRTPGTNPTKNKPTEHKRGRISDITERNGKNLTAKDIEIIKTYIHRYKTNQPCTIRQCYNDMINDQYTLERFENGAFLYEEFPPDQRPTFDQFRYRLREQINKSDRKKARMGNRQFRNQCRPLTGTALNGANGPADIAEMDACELDIAVVSETDRTKTVGSPVVYFMVDVYSKLILGASLSFDNNSILAMTNCLASLVEDKAQVLGELGLTIAPTKSGLTITDVMPSHVKPRVIRLDHGSDFISKQSQRIHAELGIEIQYAPPATGSLKSVVERSFRAFQENFVSLTAHTGAKDYRNGVSKHNKEAKLTIHDMRLLMYSFILQHNSRQHESLYHLTPDMVKNKVGRIPAEVWRYGVQHIANPMYISDTSQYLYSLLIPVTAKLKRTGILYKNLRFIPNDNELFGKMSSEKPQPIEIRIDLRNVSKIYYMDSRNRLRTAGLVNDVNHQELAAMTWPQYEQFQKEERKLLAEKDVESEKLRRAHQRLDKSIIKEAKVLSGKGRSDDKNMRETRAEEKSRVARELAFDNRFTPKQVPEPPEPPKENIFEVVDTSKMTQEELDAYRQKLLLNLIEDDD